MVIPEQQLQTWSTQGSVQQSRDTYATVKGALEDPNAPYNNHEYSTFLQGSYGNDTNIRGRDSDVDVVMRLGDRFLFDVEEVGDLGKTAFHRVFPGVEYGYAEFKRDVLAWIIQKFPNDVNPGTKAIRINGRNNRRDADVLPCIRFRRYYSFSDNNRDNFAEGICFFRTDGTRIVNYPKQHADNCTSKHQATNSYFKAMVRIVKNMRNRMAELELIEDGLAPSYYLEGMLWNVPNNLYGHSYGQSFTSAFRWLRQCDRTQLVCANQQHYLLRDGSPVCWEPRKFETFLTAIINFWNNY